MRKRLEKEFQEKISEQEKKFQEQKNTTDRTMRENFLRMRNLSFSAENQLRRQVDLLHEERTELHNRMNEMQTMIERINYENAYPKPDKLKDHQLKFPNAFYIQVLGKRGAGKSTFINKLLRTLGYKGERLQTDCVECTTETTFVDITDLIKNKPERYTHVFLVDQENF